LATDLTAAGWPVIRAIATYWFYDWPSSDRLHVINDQLIVGPQVMRNEPRIRAMLVDITARCSERPQFDHALSIEAAEEAIGAILWAYGSRPTDAGVIYAYDTLYRALGIDWAKSNIVYLAADAADNED
jgi:hypothetical protein